MYRFSLSGQHTYTHDKSGTASPSADSSHGDSHVCSVSPAAAPPSLGERRYGSAVIRIAAPQEPFPKNGLAKTVRPKAIPKARQIAARERCRVRRGIAHLRSDAGRMPRVDATRMAQAATKIQAHFRGQRDRAIVEVKKAQAEFRAKSKAERDLLFAMVRQSSLEGLTDVQAMTKVSQHVQRAPRRLGRLNSCFTPATLRLRPVSSVCTGA